MLAAGTITTITIFGGCALALFFYGISVWLSGKYEVPMEVVLGLTANGMTLSTIGCFLYNLGYIVLLRSMNGSETSMQGDSPVVVGTLNIQGNEATAFFAFLYAFLMIGAAVRRNIISLRNR